MKEKNAKVSVIMGVYNCADTLEKAIESIFAQTYADWELIICDDGSKDNSYEIAKKYAKMYPDKVKLICHTENLYLSATLNDCLKIATGHYIARMDADDMSMPHRFEQQIEFLQNNPQFQLVGSAMQLFNETGDANILRREEFPDKYSLRNGTPFSHPTIMTYKYVYDTLNGYTVSERTRFGQDYDLWFRFYAKGYVGANIQTPLYRFKEDINAIKRRTFKSRIDSYKTILFGYKLLGYPLMWYIKPTLALLKGFVPSRVVFVYRKLQALKKG